MFLCFQRSESSPMTGITWEIRQPSKVLVAYTQLGRQILSPHTAISFHVADPHFPGRKVSNITILASTDFPPNLLQQLFFPGLKDVRIEGHLVPQQTRRKKMDSMRQIRRICTAFACPEGHSSSEIQLNFLHNNFQFCHINVTRSSSFDLNPTPHKSKIPKLPKSEEKVFAYELVSFVNSKGNSWWALIALICL